MPRRLLLVTLSAIGLVATLDAQAPPQSVVLVTLDGARIEEIFGGLDVEIVRSQLRERQRLEDQALYKR